jgi:hypothetical protein
LLPDLSRQLRRAGRRPYDQQIGLVLDEPAQAGEYGGMVVQ